MREYKFRGLPIEDVEGVAKKDKFVYGNLIVSGKDRWIVGPIAEFTDEYIAHEWWVKVRPETVGQYIGREDKKGVEIYASDILGDEIGGFVTWCDELAGFAIDVLGEVLEVEFWEISTDDLDVIGNIHQDPELLAKLC